MAYSIQDVTCKASLRKQMIFNDDSCSNKVKAIWNKCATILKLKRLSPVTTMPVPSVETPWKIARGLKGRFIPLFVAESHLSTYYVVEQAIKEGFLDPEKTIVINFDQHPDDMPIYYLGKHYKPCFNNWVSHLLENKMISAYKQIEKPSDLKELNIEALRDKHIVISVDIDYFDWFREHKDKSIEDGIEEIVKFMKENSLNIRVISMAYSYDWCRLLSRHEVEEIANRLCLNMNAQLSEDCKMAQVSYVSQLGTAELQLKPEPFGECRRDIISPNL
jgi:hypothetical protein